jgi:hypothetical protein
MTRCPSFARAALVLATPVLVLAAPAAFAQPPLEHAMHAEYVNGGVTKEEADYLRVQAPSYPLEILFSKATRAGNAFAADVNVTIRDERGADVLSVQSAEPILLAKLPPGRYHVEATYEGRTRTAEVTLGGGHQKLGFSW